MKKYLFLILLSYNCFARPKSKEVLDKLHVAKAYFQQKWPDVSAPIPRPDRIRPSNIWTRAVYYEGLMELYKIDPKAADMKYMLDWANFHQWNLRDGVKTRNADNQACAQIYLDLFDFKADSARILPIKTNVDLMVNSAKADDWSWVDCLQMSMPVFTRLGVRFSDNRYFEKMYDLYAFTKNKHGGSGLYDKYDKNVGLWWRDKDFVPPYKEPNGENCYWSRGNGWVFAALVRTLELMPKNAPHRAEYEQDFISLAHALLPLQLKDGFWNVSLMDPTHFGGPEATGTSLFVYGMSWGVRNKLLPKKKFDRAILAGWDALSTCVHPNGFLGNVQGTGKEPKDSQPVSNTHVPDFEDFGTGCFLLAGVELIKYLK